MDLDPAPDIDSEDRERLLEAAWDARDNAYNRREGELVGAALLTEDGDIYAGANLVATTQEFCAERSAVMNAVTHGYYHFDAVAAVAETEAPLPPCGVCRQLLAEFAHIAGHDMAVFTQGEKEDVHKRSLMELLPEAFSRASLGRDVSRYEEEKK